QYSRTSRNLPPTCRSRYRRKFRRRQQFLHPQGFPQSPQEVEPNRRSSVSALGSGPPASERNRRHPHENIARDAVLRNKLMENDRVMGIVLDLLRSWNSIPLLGQGLFYLVRLFEQARDRQLQLAWQWFLKPLWAIVNDRGCFFPPGPLVEAVLLFTQIVDTYFLDKDTSDEFHVEIKKEFDNGINIPETVDVLLFYCAYPDNHVRFHAFFTFSYLATSMGSIVLENKLAVETLVGYLRKPVLFIRIKCLQTLNYLQACKIAEDSDSDCSSSNTSDSDSSDSEYGSEAESESGFSNFTGKHHDRLCKFKNIAESTLPPELAQEIRNSGHSHYLSLRRAFDASKSLFKTRTPREAAHVMARTIQLTPLSVVETDLLGYAKARVVIENAHPSLDEAVPSVLYFYYAAAASSLNDPDSSCEDTVSFCNAGLALTSVKGVGEQSYLHLGLLQMASMAFETLARSENGGLFRTMTQLNHLKSALKYEEEYVRFAAPDVPDLREMIAETIHVTLLVRNNSFFNDPKGLALWLDEMKRKLGKADLVASYMDLRKIVENITVIEKISILRRLLGAWLN
ncbi:hypothetical protein HK102_003819, partial [Quaeritorhiza haematococci]